MDVAFVPVAKKHPRNTQEYPSHYIRAVHSCTRGLPLFGPPATTQHLLSQLHHPPAKTCRCTSIHNTC